MTLLPENVKSQSTTYPVLEQIPNLATGIIGSLKPLFLDFWELLKSTIDSIKVKGESIQ